jgi:hypothetical protein
VLAPRSPRFGEPYISCLLHFSSVPFTLSLRFGEPRISSPTFLTCSVYLNRTFAFNSSYFHLCFRLPVFLRFGEPHISYPLYMALFLRGSVDHTFCVISNLAFRVPSATTTVAKRRPGQQHTRRVLPFSTGFTLVSKFRFERPVTYLLSGLSVVAKPGHPPIKPARRNILPRITLSALPQRNFEFAFVSFEFLTSPYSFLFL